MTVLTPLEPTDIQLAGEFLKENPHLYPAGNSSLQTQLRNAKTNGLISSGAAIKQLGHWYFVKPLYLSWFAAGRQA